VNGGPPVVDARLLVRRLDAGLRTRPILLVSDFDGTLATIVMDPWGAAIVASARRALRRISGVRGVRVVLLSGRTATDLASRARVGGATYLGSHGEERGTLPRHARAETIRTAHDPALAGFVGDAGRIARAVEARIAQSWLVVERKGPAVAFHFRAAPDIPEAGRIVAAAVDEADREQRFVRHVGRRILELRPPGAVGKGDALRTLVDEVRPALTLVLGDDRTDADAFLALRALRDAGRTGGLAVAVDAHPEMPEDVAAAADVVLASPGETARFLSALARRLRSD